MKKLILLTAVLGFSLNFSTSSVAMPSGDCSGTPGDAVLELPAPINAWGQIICNGKNHSISGQGDWFWKGDSNYSQVQVSSSGQYFKDIQVRELKGDSVKQYVSVLEGKDSKSKPKTFVLELTADDDTTSKIVFFDYGMNSVWGMRCHTECDASSRFMLLNRAGL